ncbi:hypothetical protein [Stutzerimonas stutzeri]|uniref:hypothetical protein n=1 Tax=Stutzerimonas stutzeri TaxID=316 RepID=UPI0015E37C84|nr:hypothetical protein [Stutzerimonas stutzeri]MBA1261990.1 hypothetical protein [Stutzerimonas stutzeri]
MKIPAMEQTESIHDVLCDVCGESTRVEGYGLQFGTLHASWGYGSTHDGERYEVHLRIPRSSGHPFHEHLTTDSTLIRPPIPRASGH